MSKLFGLLTAVIAKVKNTENKIPNKVSDLKNDAGYLTKQVQPDLNQNNPSAPDYVKNRPFWTGDPVEKVLYEKTHDNLYDARFFEEPFTVEGLEIGKEYTVSVWGKTYNCVAYAGWDDPTCVALGSTSMIDGANNPADGEEPFGFFTVVGASYSCLNVSWEYMFTNFPETAELTEYKFSISSVIEEIHKIEPKYLPKSTENTVGAISKREIMQAVTPGYSNEFSQGSTYTTFMSWLNGSAFPVTVFVTSTLEDNLHIEFLVTEVSRSIINDSLAINVTGIDLRYGSFRGVTVFFPSDGDGNVEDSATIESISPVAKEQLYLMSMVDGELYRAELDENGQFKTTKIPAVEVTK